MFTNLTRRLLHPMGLITLKGDINVPWRGDVNQWVSEQRQTLKTLVSSNSLQFRSVIFPMLDRLQRASGHWTGWRCDLTRDPVKTKELPFGEFLIDEARENLDKCIDDLQQNDHELHATMVTSKDNDGVGLTQDELRAVIAHLEPHGCTFIPATIAPALSIYGITGALQGCAPYVRTLENALGKMAQHPSFAVSPGTTLYRGVHSLFEVEPGLKLKRLDPHTFIAAGSRMSCAFDPSESYAMNGRPSDPTDHELKLTTAAHGQVVDMRRLTDAVWGKGERGHGWDEGVVPLSQSNLRDCRVDPETFPNLPDSRCNPSDQRGPYAALHANLTELPKSMLRHYQDIMGPVSVGPWPASREMARAPIAPGGSRG